jgi:broad specificity phosphatase PhoE
MATGARITGLVTRWWWVRHAPVPNPEARCYGQSDKDCDVSNRALFEHQAKLLPRGAVWYSSNLLRARRTAQHLAEAGADMGKLQIEPDLAEQHFGDWQGLTYVEIAEKHGSNHLFWLGPPEHRPPGGESFVDLRDRTVRSIDRLTADQCLAHPDRAFRAGRSTARLARRLRELHAARPRRGQGGGAGMRTRGA